MKLSVPIKVYATGKGIVTPPKPQPKEKK